jgi:glutaredoxin
MKYKLKVIILEDCPYSIAAIELLNNNNISFQKKLVSQNNKEKFKTNIISTFPQIYMLNKTRKILLGGYSDLEEIMNIIKSSKNLDKIKEELKKKNLNNKIILRIIEIFIS